MGWENIARKMIFTTAFLMFLINEVAGELCKGYGHYCNAPLKCCASKCCYGQDYDTSVVSYYRWNLWNMWYFWFIIVFILMSCFGGCGYYKRRQMLFSRQRLGTGLGTSGHAPAAPRVPRTLRRGTHVPVTVAVPIFPSAYAYAGPDSDQSTYPYGVPVGDSGQPGSYIMAPPPYSEVVSHPGLYPVNKTELPPYPGQGGLPVTTVTNTEGVTGAVGSQSSAAGQAGGDTVSRGQPPLPPYSAVAGSPPITAETLPTSTDEPSAAPTVTANARRLESS